MIQTDVEKREMQCQTDKIEEPKMVQTEKEYVPEKIVPKVIVPEMPP